MARAHTHIGQAEEKDTMGERSKASNFKIVLLGEGRVGKTSMVGPLSEHVCARACVCVCVRACVRACVICARFAIRAPSFAYGCARSLRLTRQSRQQP